MRTALVLPLSLTLLLSRHAILIRSELPTAAPNPNTAPAGELRDGVLTVMLEAKLTMWHPDGDSLPGMRIEAFAAEGKTPEVPGPLIRVPQGTEIRASVRNSLERDTLTFHLPASLSGGAAGSVSDSVIVPPGDTRELRVRASAPGNYIYRATTSTPLGRRFRLGGLLTGALIVDSADAVTPPRDRVFVLLEMIDSLEADGTPSFGRAVFAINGRSWPHTERLGATVGDTLRWRVINASLGTHPMHLHGFFYRVDAFAGPLVAQQGQGPPGRWVVTERMSSFSTMSMTWVPERAGKWLFHCHFQGHVAPHAPLDLPAPIGVSRGAARSRVVREHALHGNHALGGMGGLVLGIIVSPRDGATIAQPAPGRRRLRLVAVQDSAFPDSAPSMRFVLEDLGAGGRLTEAGPGASPPMFLTRDEPVSITVVNRLQEPTAVHWHGIELESYYDGVAGFGGFGTRVAPIIAPSDSFEVRFTPPRPGTFIYHSHVDEPRQHRAGLAGALLVRDAAPRGSSDDLIFFIKSARGGPAAPAPLEINGEVNPDTIVLRVGRRYRLRFISVAVGNPNSTVTLTARPDSSLANLRDTLITQWRPVAKDGADLPEQARATSLARQIVGMGETYDFEFVPRERAQLRIEVRAAAPPPRGRLLARVPIRVE